MQISIVEGDDYGQNSNVNEIEARAEDNVKEFAKVLVKDANGNITNFTEVLEGITNLWVGKSQISLNFVSSATFKNSYGTTGYQPQSKNDYYIEEVRKVSKVDFGIHFEWRYINTNSVEGSEVWRTTEDYKLWIQFPEIDSITADQIVSDEFQSVMSNWTEGVTGEQRDESGAEMRSSDLKWGENKLLPEVEAMFKNDPYFENGVEICYEGSITPVVYGAAIGCGVLDGLLGSLHTIYELGKGVGGGAVGFYKAQYNYVAELVKLGIKEKSIISVFERFVDDGIGVAKKIIDGAIKVWDTIKTITENLNLGKIKLILDGVYDGLRTWFTTLISYTKEGGYIVGGIVFDLIFNTLTAGAGSALANTKYLSNFMKILKNLEGKIVNNMEKFVSGLMKNMDDAMRGTKKWFKCKILGEGCFVEDTPVLIVNNANQYSLRNTGKALALAAAMPIVSIPIQEVQLLDYVVANETVNSGYGITASTDNTYMGLFDKDPYTSDQQRTRDKYEINDKDWNEVVFEEVNGTSIAKLALHQDWIHQKSYVVGGVVNLNLPEQGIDGPFTITSIKHILPQKKPVDEDPEDEYGYKPVTALFIHQSDAVYNIAFDDSETIGVTYQHPIYSITAGDWRLAGELEIGEKVLTKRGEVTVTASEKKGGTELVYNLEVKDWHNFLVGEEGVVVHNICWKEVADFFKMSLAKKRKIIQEAYDAWYPQIFGRRGFLEGVMRKTKFKDWNHTYDLAKNFKAIDFYRNVNGKNIVASMKTTRLEDVSKWINQNKTHLADLMKGKDDKFFEWGSSNHIRADIVQLNLFTKKGLSAAERRAWKNAIESYTEGKLKVIVEVIEESL